MQPDETRGENQGLLDICDAKSAGLVQTDHSQQAVPDQLCSHDPLPFLLIVFNPPVSLVISESSMLLLCVVHCWCCSAFRFSVLGAKTTTRYKLDVPSNCWLFISAMVDGLTGQDHFKYAHSHIPLQHMHMYMHMHRPSR